MGTKHRPSLDKRIREFCLSLDKGLWIGNIGKNHVGSTEYSTFQNDIVIDGDVVLYFGFVSDDYLVPNKIVLAQRTFISNFRSPAAMNKMPDTASVTDLCSEVNDG